MSLLRFTGSKAELARRCTHWLDPQVLWFESDSPEAAGGRAVHRMLAAVTNDGVLEAADDEQVRALYAAGYAWLQTHRRALFRGEVAFAIDAVTGQARELEDPAGADPRWYADPELRARLGVTDTEVCLRTDLCGMGMDDEGAFAFLGDYKCHFGPEYVDARAQLEIGALALARAWGVDRVKAVAVHLWADRDTVEERYELGPARLEDVARELAELAAAPFPGAPTEGPWCGERYCGARASCGATQELAASALALVPEDRLAKGRDFAKPLQTNDEVARALVWCDLLEEMVAARRKEAKAVADREPVFTLEGEVYAGQDEIVEKPDLGVPGAREVLEELGLDFAVTESTTWAAMKAVGGAPRADEARERFRAIGAVRTSTRRVYKARPAKAPVAAIAKAGGEPANRRAS